MQNLPQSPREEYLCILQLFWHHLPSKIWIWGNTVPLWYYTNTGLANQTTFNTVDEDALTIVTSTDGITTAICTTSLKELKGLVEDHNLTFEQFQVAALHMLMAMQHSEWPSNPIIMMEMF